MLFCSLSLFQRVYISISINTAVFSSAIPKMLLIPQYSIALYLSLCVQICFLYLPFLYLICSVFSLTSEYMECS